MKVCLILLVCLAFPSVASATCRTTATGRTVCSNGENAAGYNSRTGTAWKSQENQNGVRTTESSKGGEAKTKNGMGVYEAPNGTKCAKGKNHKGCQ